MENMQGSGSRGPGLKNPVLDCISRTAKTTYKERSVNYVSVFRPAYPSNDMTTQAMLSPRCRVQSTCVC